MKFIQSDQLRLQINEAAKNKTPFFFSINYELTEGLFIENPIAQDEILFQFNGKGNKPSENISTKKAEISLSPISLEQYAKMFEVMQNGINKGDIQVVNLTVKTPIKANISCKEIFLRSQSPYQIYIPGKYVCFSPERFVKMENRTISANPMKGTIDASIPNAEEIILNNPKEIAELDATTASVIKELKTVSTNVAVKRYRYIDKIKSLHRNLLQVSTEVEGELPENNLSKLGDVLFSLLPATSITGSPNKNAETYIRLAENEPRGYYCGIAGYFDGKALDTCVLIRFIEIDGDNLFFRSGGGVTIDSVCQKEYEEVLNKIYLPFV